MPRISPWPPLFFFTLMAGLFWLASGTSDAPKPPLEPSFPAVSSDLGSNDLQEVEAMMRQKVEETYGR
ncbi:MAG: hypothetical protein KC621_26530 [Myxococcales bacterium]|nr:hypothetical protein [Myxococcales bacterium]